MKMSFMPGKMFLESEADGTVRVTVNGEEVYRGRSERSAVAKFNSLRKEMEQKFPVVGQPEEDRLEALRRMTLDSLIGHNSLGGRKKKTTAGGTRTFGG
jgi:hypothetical protein